MEGEHTGNKNEMVNEQMVARLATQNLPKCHLDMLNRDPALFHPWKAGFKAMISDTNVLSVQEVNYLSRLISGEAKKVVDNYWKRKQHDPSKMDAQLPLIKPDPH